MDPPVSVPTDAKHMPSAIAAADPPLDPGRSRHVDRIANGAECRLIAGGAERELVQVGLADDDGAGAAGRLTTGASAAAI